LTLNQASTLLRSYLLLGAFATLLPSQFRAVCPSAAACAAPMRRGGDV
jgi:hypothetical protein